MIGWWNICQLSIQQCISYCMLISSLWALPVSHHIIAKARLIQCRRLSTSIDLTWSTSYLISTEQNFHMIPSGHLKTRCTGWSKKSRPNFKHYNFLNFYSTKKVKTSPWSTFTWKFVNYKLVHNSQMHEKIKANKQVVIPLAHNTSCNRLKQCFSRTAEGPFSPNGQS